MLMRDDHRLEKPVEISGLTAPSRKAIAAAVPDVQTYGREVSRRSAKAAADEATVVSIAYRLARVSGARLRGLRQGPGSVRREGGRVRGSRPRGDRDLGLTQAGVSRSGSHAAVSVSD
jgi:hypothetical protein